LSSHCKRGFCSCSSLTSLWVNSTQSCQQFVACGTDTFPARTTVVQSVDHQFMESERSMMMIRSNLGRPGLGVTGVREAATGQLR
jgi:hypothetical protein